MATKLFFRALQDNGLSGPGPLYYDMVTTAGSGSACSGTTNGQVNSTASGTEIQWTKTAGGTVMAFVSGGAPAGGFTLSGTVTFRMGGRENSMNTNAGVRARLFKWSPGNTETEIGGGPFDDGAEFNSGTVCTGNGIMDWTGSPSSTAFAEDDRLVCKLYITNIGTMAAGTCDIDWDAGSGDSKGGDAFCQINENVTFKAESVQAATDGQQWLTRSASEKSRQTAMIGY